MKAVDLEKLFSGVVPACTRQLGTLATGCDSREGAAERLQVAVLERGPMPQEGASHCISCLLVVQQQMDISADGSIGSPGHQTTLSRLNFPPITAYGGEY